jgi:hypothetical protein
VNQEGKRKDGEGCAVTQQKGIMKGAEKTKGKRGGSCETTKGCGEFLKYGVNE